MVEFDISQYVLPVRKSADHGLTDVVKWLDEHVGKWDQVVYNRTGTTVRQGQGWSINTVKKVTKGHFVGISWNCCIEDEIKASHFALKWIN